MTMASTALCNEGPRAAAKAMVKTMLGKAKNMSVTRMMTESMMPPANPANAPIAEPTTLASMTSRRASGSESRAPYRTRLSTSRPSSSVPNKWAADGARRDPALGAVGEPGAINGASAATKSQLTSTTIPKTAPGRRNSPSNVRPEALPGSVRSLGPEPSARAPVVALPATALTAAPAGGR